MITEELIIDGTAVDMDGSTAVTLNFVSNLLGDIGAIETSRSQTISLPKTAHNRAVLDDPASPSRESAARYVRHTAKYRRNGVEVISDGYAILLRCADTYEVALYWGILSKLQTWLDSDGNIGDLGWEPTSGERTWDKGNTTPARYIGQDLGRLFWADYDCGVGDRADTESSTEEVALHPFVPVAPLLDLICENAGITGRDLPSDITGQIAGEGVFVEGTNLEGTHNLIFATELSFIVDFGTCYAHFTFPSNDYFYTRRSYLSGTGGNYCNEAVMNYEGRLRIYIDIILSYSGLVYNYLYVGTRYSNSYMITGVAVTGEDSQRRFTADIYLDVAEGYAFRIFIPFATSISVVSYDFGVGAPSGDDQMVLGDDYPASANLPDITQADFLKAVCAMHGMFVMQTSDGGLTLTTLEALTGNRTNAVDWSDRLVASDTPCEPSETALSWGDYAKHNRFRYKEDDTVSTDGDGDMMVYNEALDYEKDIVTLPFSATDETSRHGETKALIPHYSREDGGDIRTESVKARIVQFTEGSDGNAVARFSGLRFSRLLSNWSGLSALLNSCVAITEDFRLTEHDLLNLDYLRPVYLRQYGRYYGIVSVQTQDDGTCRAELLRLPLEDTTTTEE